MMNPGRRWLRIPCLLLAGLALIGANTTARAAGPAADFALKNINVNSPRGTNVVSPRDYLQQVSGYYFFMASCGYCRAQVEHLQSLQNELRSAGTPLNVEILAVNETGYESVIYIPSVTMGRNLAMVQDTAQARVRQNWGAEIRDVVILDAFNNIAAVYNLTSHDLALEANRAALRQMFVNAAALSDTDGDRLPDPWEMHWLQTLAQNGDDDPDGDKVSNYFEFVFGTDPQDGSSFPKLQFEINDGGRFTVRFMRWAGTLANYQLEGAPDLHLWSSGGFRAVSRNLFDGTGRSEMSYSFDKTIVTQKTGFIRLQARPLP